MNPLLIYLHGLNSSSQSHKARLTADYIQQCDLDVTFWAPDLPLLPRDISVFLQSRLENSVGCRPIYIMGSSLGGFLGAWLQNWLLSKASDYPVRLVLINPVVFPNGRVEDFLGPQQNFHTGQEWVLDRDYIDQLQALEVDLPSEPDSALLMVQTGDDVLDYREAVSRYSDSPMEVQEGGSHGFDHFEEALPGIMIFFRGSFEYRQTPTG